MRHYLAILYLFVILINCSIKAPEVSITGEKTALEEQVLGDYRQIESDTWVIASTRATGSGGASGTNSQQAVLNATQNQKFNKDEIDEFKDDQVVGENNKGYLEILSNEKYSNDLLYKRLVDQVIAEENSDRKIIYEQLLAGQNINSKERLQSVYWIFAKQNIQESQKGTKTQEKDGTWNTKD
jgi:uncharacterized protein YdbL (DUF1318 family)